MPGIHKMWRLPLGLPLILAVILATSAIRAEETVDATDPQQVLAVVQIFDEAALGTDNLGDPKIEGRIEGEKYQLFFYGCSRGRDCKNLTFSASWVGDELTDAMMAGWNREKRFGKAYLDQDGAATVEMNVNLNGGVSLANLEATIDWWRFVLDEFADKFGF